MEWIKDTNKEIMVDKKYPVSALSSELVELLQAISNLDKENFKEEVGDVAWTGQAMLHQRTGLNFPLIAGKTSLEKYRNRRKVWEDIFSKHDVKFHPDFLSGGSNYRKPKKIVGALGAAGKQISEQDALELLNEFKIKPETI